MMRALLLSTALLAGCAPATLPVPTSLELPSARLMKDPGKLPPLKGGDDLIAADAALRAQCAREFEKERGLQTYIRRITGTKP